MNDAEVEVQKARVLACFEHWLYRTSMRTQWFVHFTWLRERVKTEREGGLPSGYALFEVVAEWERLRAQITVYLPEVENFSDDDLSKAVIEELMHILVNEQREWHRMPDGGQPACVVHEERVVAQLTVALWQACQYDPKVETDYPWPKPMEAATRT